MGHAPFKGPDKSDKKATWRPGLPRLSGYVLGQLLGPVALLTLLMTCVIWLTQFPITDPRAASSCEAEFARWIPGNPFDALQATHTRVPAGT